MTVIISLLPVLLGLLGQFLVAFLKNWDATAKDPDFADVVLGYVRSAEANSMLSDSQKYSWVVDRIKEYAVSHEMVLKDSLINAAVEVALQHVKSLGA